MKWELDDNARSGFHYLMLGVLVVAVLALGNTALDHLYSPIGPHGSYGHGYLIEDDGNSMIVAGTTRGERIATAILLAFVTGLIIACVSALLMRSMRLARSKWISITGRVAFSVSLVYFIYAALYLPPREFIGMRDDVFIVRERDVILNDVPWPERKSIILIPFQDVEKVSVDIGEGTAGKVIHRIIIDHASESLVVGCGARTGPDDSASAIFARGRAAHLEQMMLRP